MPKVTLKHVAAKAGVSYQTVSKILNKKAHVTPETEERVWQAVRELDYKPNIAARNFRTQSSYLIGYGYHHNRGESFWSPILDAFLYSVIDAAEARNYLTVFFTDSDNIHCPQPTIYAELYERKQADGFVIANVLKDDPRVAFLIDQSIPFAAFGRANDDWDHCWVDVDGFAGIEAVMTHLQERGHQRIAYINWPDLYRTGIHREAGYRQAMEKAGLTIDPTWVVHGSNSTQTGEESMAHFLSLPPQRRPTAIVCVCDQIAVGVIHAAHEAGLKIGRDLAVTGYDDIPIAKHLRPALTTVRQPIHEAGQLVVDLILKQISGESITQKGMLLTPELVVRGSS